MTVEKPLKVVLVGSNEMTMDLFFTRNIGDPSAGIRLTGKDGPYSLGVMTADDRSPGLAIPAYYPLSGLRSYFTVARVSRDIFRQSSVGARCCLRWLGTGYRGHGSESRTLHARDSTVVRPKGLETRLK